MAGQIMMQNTLNDFLSDCYLKGSEMIVYNARGGLWQAWHWVGTRRFKRVLHVATNVIPVRGAPNFIQCYIRQDAGRLHSLALTRQLAIKVPSSISSAVREAEGASTSLILELGGAWAARLRNVAGDYGLVVLGASPRKTRRLPT